MPYILVNESLTREIFENLIGDYVSGVTGMERNSCRPAHQTIHPAVKQGSEVCLYNIVEEETPGYWGIATDKYIERSEIKVRFYFYGKKSYTYARKLRMSFRIQQNMWDFTNMGIAVMRYFDIIETPYMINDIEIVRHDIDVLFSVAREETFDQTYFNSIPAPEINARRS